MTKSASIGTSDGPHYSDPDENLPLGEPPVQKEEEGVVGQKLASELVRQQELYADLRRKTQQLKQLQQVREREGEERNRRERGGKGGERWEGGDEGEERSTCIQLYMCMICLLEEVWRLL